MFITAHMINEYFTIVSQSTTALNQWIIFCKSTYILQKFRRQYAFYPFFYLVMFLLNTDYERAAQL